MNTKSQLKKGTDSAKEKFEVIRKKFSTWALLLLVRIYYWARLQSAHQAVSLKKRSASLLDAEIRLCRDSLLQIGEDDQVDMVIEYVARQLTGRPLLPELDTAIAKNSELATSLLIEAKARTQVQEAVKTYFLAGAYLSALCNNQTDADHALNEARVVDPSSVSFDSVSLSRKKRTVEKRLREVRALLAERSSLKLEFKLLDLSTLIGIVSALFVISGYLYTHYFFSMFGVEVSHFFTLGDYLAASVEQIRYGAFSALFGAFAFLTGLRHASMRSRLEIKNTHSIKAREEKFVIALTVAVTLSTIWGIYSEHPDFGYMRLASALLSNWIAGWFSRIFFKKPLPVYAAMVGLLTFASCIAISAYQKRMEIMSATTLGSSPNIELTEKIFGNQEKAHFLASNSNYIFLLSEDKKYIHVVPRDKLKEAIINIEH